MDKPNILKNDLRLTSGLEVGQVVLSKQGKDRGRVYIVTHIYDTNLALADAKHFNVTKPKLKNPKHVQPTNCRLTELIPVIESGRNIDRGRFVQLVSEQLPKVALL